MSAPSNTGAAVYTQGFGSAPLSALGIVPVVSTVNPAPTNIQGPAGPFKVGQVWINSFNNTSWTLTSLSSSAGSVIATWVETGGAGSGSVTSVSGTGNQITASPTTGGVIVSLPAAIITPGSLEVKSGFSVDAGLAEFKATVTVDFDAGSAVNFGVAPTFNTGFTTATGPVTIVGDTTINNPTGTGTLTIGNSSGGGAIRIDVAGAGFNLNGFGNAVNIAVDGAPNQVTLGTNTPLAATSINGATLTLSGGAGGFAILGQTDIEIGLQPNGKFRFENQGSVLAFAGAGAAASIGQATLVAGSATVSTSSVDANSEIFLSVQAPGGTQGFLSIGTIIPNTSFVINSSDAADISAVNWWIIEVG